MLLTGAATICELQLQHFFIGQQALSKCTCTFAAAANPRFMLRLQACTLQRQFFCLFLFCSCRNGREVTALHHNQFQRQNSCLWVVLAVDKNGIDALINFSCSGKITISIVLAVDNNGLHRGFDATDHSYSYKICTTGHFLLRSQYPAEWNPRK